MEIFQANKKYFAILGLTANQLVQTHLYNKKKIGGVFIFCLSIVSHILNILVVANNFMEYIECISTTYSVIVVATSYFTIAFNTEKLFEIFDSTEQLVNKSEYPFQHKAMHFQHDEQFWKNSTGIVEYPASKKSFIKINHLVEKCSETIYFAVVKVSPQCVIYPKFIISYMLYFATDLGRDSFELPFPIW